MVPYHTLQEHEIIYCTLVALSIARSTIPRLNLHPESCLPQDASMCITMTVNITNVPD